MTLNRNDLPESKNISNEYLLSDLEPTILDPLARSLIQKIQWFPFQGFLTNQPSDHSSQQEDCLSYPMAVLGEGPPVLLLHGFDSCFLEFRRLAPLLTKTNQLFIPDLHGFGFTPRPLACSYNPEAVFLHLSKVLSLLPSDQQVGVIGASMGGAVAMELSRRYPDRINRLLLLAPAGLVGKSMPLFPPLDSLGVCFLRQPFVRRMLCRQAFANPDSSVGEAENQIASLHLQVQGWSTSLASFARSGGFAQCGTPLPRQPFRAIFGLADRIIPPAQKKEIYNLLDPFVDLVDNCGHLPHLDIPEYVASSWLEKYPH